MRPRQGGGLQCPSCVVDGFKTDLSSLHYHWRHMVFEAHSSVQELTIVNTREHAIEASAKKAIQ
ncbi:hypothetical protein EJB05_45042 [Eragrostis curvula]|uniref:Uncharacterized protein n=1 Tax=Eragrostis curvula TaxID=38414 RepID=A0A5J9TJ54_9POAL|nr:hypothetical protein EJB05_45042 [Eragrostis curvula]